MVKCPACEKESLWDDRFNRYFHRDGSCAAACWSKTGEQEPPP